MKYTETLVSFSEIPDEISLCINISNCPIHCPGCHSQWLWEDIGTELTVDVLANLILENPGITCVCFMGGKIEDVYNLIFSCKSLETLKKAWYTGESKMPDICYLHYLDFIKVGPYIEEKGGLDNPNTNQRMYRKDSKFSSEISNCIVEGKTYLGWKDITERFWSKSNI